jgi:hypothetical protein
MALPVAMRQPQLRWPQLTTLVQISPIFLWQISLRAVELRRAQGTVGERVKEKCFALTKVLHGRHLKNCVILFALASPEFLQLLGLCQK